MSIELGWFKGSAFDLVDQSPYSWFSNSAPCFLEILSRFFNIQLSRVHSKLLANIVYIFSSNLETNNRQ